MSLATSLCAASWAHAWALHGVVMSEGTISMTVQAHGWKGQRLWHIGTKDQDVADDDAFLEVGIDLEDVARKASLSRGVNNTL